MRIVIALGGNALQRRGEPADVQTQRKNVSVAAAAVADLARHHDVVLTHGNGPQVGLLALQSEARGEAAAPLDVLGAESEGMIGYLIEQELSNLLPERDIATLLTQVEVDPEDPAFAHPTKPIGPVLSESEARRLSETRGWRTVAGEGGLRRVVPSPAPQHIREIRTIELLMRLDVLVVCGGGGGIPVVRTPEGLLHGVEAVVDKDHSAALLATRLGADRLLLLTDVPAVYSDWPEPAEQIQTASPRALRKLHFEPGSMAPKVDAACRFVKQTGKLAAIGALEDADRVLRGEAGTQVLPGAEPVTLRPVES